MGTDIGKTMTMIFLNSPHPSIPAASKTLSGIFDMYCFTKNIPNTLTIPGKIIPRILSLIPKKIVSL